MKRSKKVVFVAHCILNVNSKVKSYANYESSLKTLIHSFLENDYGIVQLPCPELQFLGLKRWSMSKEQYDTFAYREFCRSMAKDVVNQMVIYKNEGYEIIALYGIDGSPTCGINNSCRGNEGGCIDESAIGLEYISDEKGIFMEEIDKLVSEFDIEINYLSINEENPEGV